jgi:imidazolonepropionase-like amidohydrolase
VIDATGSIVMPGLIDACHSSRSPEHTDAALEARLSS